MRRYHRSRAVVDHHHRGLLSAAGGALPYRWSIGGPLPLGLSLALESRITGTPSVAGACPITLRVNDASGQGASQERWVVVDPRPSGSPARARCRGPRPALGMETRLAAEGGTGPYTWSVIGGLPPGLTLASDGRLAGRPAVAGPYLFR